MRSAALRLWLPIVLSLLLHYLALDLLNSLLLHGRSGQVDPSIDVGLKITLADPKSDSSQSPLLHQNAAIPLSNNALPGRAPDLAQLTINGDSRNRTVLEKPIAPAAPSHPQKTVDAADTLTASSESEVDAATPTPKSSAGEKGDLDSGYIPASLVERAPIPLTQPNLDRLANATRPHAPIRLRAYVDQSGVVHDVIVMSCDAADMATAELLAGIYKDVAYMAAYDHGKQVPSRIDFTISVPDAPDQRSQASIIRKLQ